MNRVKHDEVSSPRDRHVGESDYSRKAIQPWDVWMEYSLNPWDADIVKRILRTKQVPGMTATESRIQDYEKIKHICDERIEQVKAGDPYYANMGIPPWAQITQQKVGEGVEVDEIPTWTNKPQDGFKDDG